jgi:acetylglutamate kinase
MNDIIVVKIGGSTLGEHDTTLEDIVTLQREGARPVIVHGGGAVINRWLGIHGVQSRFVRGLRVTDKEAMPVVTAVLAGVVNKDLTGRINALGGRAIGLSGADGGLLRARILSPELGYVGEVEEVATAVIIDLLDKGYTPVIAPIGWSAQENGASQLLNINADTAAGEVAVALKAGHLVFLTDVPGVMDAAKRVQPRLGPFQVEALLAQGTIDGGMIPKVQACLQAATVGTRAIIVDGRRPHALMAAIRGEAAGTVIG